MKNDEKRKILYVKTFLKTKKLLFSVSLARDLEEPRCEGGLPERFRAVHRGHGPRAQPR